MNASKKMAWAEVVVATLATIVVFGAIPFLGDQSIKLFAILAIAPAVYPLLMRARGTKIVKDERDENIKDRSTYWGSSSAWMFLVVSMIVISMWYHKEDVPTQYLFVLIWVQFAVYLGVKGVAALVLYREASRPA